MAVSPAAEDTAPESGKDQAKTSGAVKPDLGAVRAQIDGIDRQIQTLIAERALWAHQVGKAKGKLAAAVDYYRPEREAQVLRQVVDRNEGPLSDDVLVRLFREIMSACLAQQEPLKIGYLGPEGTFSQQAVYKHFGHSAKGLPLASIEEVFDEVAAGNADFGVVPVENSGQGTIQSTLDMFLAPVGTQSPLKICGEVELRVHQYLLSRTGHLEDIDRVYSHGLSLAQCRAWLRQHLPKAEKIALPSNAEAARRARNADDAGAIAGENAAHVYGLKIVAGPIEDRPDNTTRFLVIGRALFPPSGHDRTSLLVFVRDQPGALYKVLEPLARHGVSMNRIESRPSHTGLWQYAFFIEVGGHADEAPLRDALRELGAFASNVTVLGSYPVAVPLTGRGVATSAADVNEAWFAAMAQSGVRGLRAYDPGHDLVALRRRFADTFLVELGSNENPYGASPAVRAAVLDALHQLHRYPDPLGGDLKRALAAKLGVSTSQLLLGNGSHELLMQLAQVFCGPGDEVVAPQYGFAVFALATQAAGATLRIAPALPRTHPMPRGHDLDAIAASITPHTRLVYLANPNNPTGTWFGAQAFAGFIQRVPSDVLVVVDEAYAECADAPDYRSALTLLSAHPNLVVTRTFSKAYALAGLRVGYAVAHPGLVSVMERVRESFNVNLLALAAAEAALGDEAHLQWTLARNAEQRTALAEALRGRGWFVHPSQTNFLLVEFGDDVPRLEAALLARGVVLRPMGGYGLPSCSRITVGTGDENRRLLAALDAMR